MLLMCVCVCKMCLCANPALVGDPHIHLESSHSNLLDSLTCQTPGVKSRMARTQTITKHAMFLHSSQCFFYKNLRTSVQFVHHAYVMSWVSVTWWHCGQNIEIGCIIPIYSFHNSRLLLYQCIKWRHWFINMTNLCLCIRVWMKLRYFWPQVNCF